MPCSRALSTDIQLTHDLNFPGDALIGYHCKIRHNMSLYPVTRQIAINISFFSSYSDLLTSDKISGTASGTVLISASQTIHAVRNYTSSILPSPPPSFNEQQIFSMPVHKTVTQYTPHTSFNDILVSTSFSNVVLIDGEISTPHKVCLVRVKTSGVKPGTDVICLSETSCVNGLFLESVLCTALSIQVCVMSLMHR